MSTNPEARAWIRVRADALRANYRRVRESVGPNARIIAMVKADGYGLGVREVVRALEPEQPWGYGVATVDEGVGVQAVGTGRPVAVLSPVPPGSMVRALKAGLHVHVGSLSSLGQVSDWAEETGGAPRIHVEVDTGMGRSGFDWREAADWMPRIAEASGRGVAWVGYYTHLHSADCDTRTVHEQLARFRQTLEAPGAPSDGILRHALNSAAAMRTAEYAGSAVRPGIFLYGGRVGDGAPAPEPVASVHARVVHVRDAAPGTTLGYGVTYTASRPERWATLSIGYGDGLPRALGNKGSALISGRRVPIIGRTSMDVTVVDITGVPGVHTGDVATLVGADGQEEITLEEVASLAGTISYEVLTGLTRRLPRVWTGETGT